MANVVALAWSHEPSSAPASLAPSALRELDDLAADPLARGFVHVRADAPLVDALARHAERRARAGQRAVVRVGGLPTDDAFRDLAAHFSTAPLNDPLIAARDVATRADGMVLVVVEARRTQWGRAASMELARLLDGAKQGPLVLVLGGEEPVLDQVRCLEVDRRATAEDVRRFWEALAKDTEMSPALDRLDAVEAWWLAAQATPADAPAEAPAVGAAAQRLLARIVLSQRTWSARQTMALGGVAARDELVARRILAIDGAGRLVSTGVALPVLETDRADALAVAEALEACFRDDQWAAVRASELFASAGDYARAEGAAVRALGALTDATARADFWQRWEASLALVPASEAAPRLRRSAELALRCGDVDRALGFARALATRDDSYESMLTLGRATTVRGDLTTAAIVLEKALAKADCAGTRARAAVEMAEVRYTMGQLDEAKQFADAGLSEAADIETRLAARNVLGKLLLARAAFAEAEQHFAVDACDAACAGNVMAELRARLNRAIALISSGRRDEARGMLASVLDEGERAGEPRAVSFALQNLATIAILKHEYPEALRLAERAIAVCRGIGEKIALARLITNLAELRLRLGLVAEAEQALVFGRQACGPGLPAARAAHFALVAARIHLARGNTLEAAAEVASASASAASSTDGNKVAECHRVAARIALEDGDLGRAQRAIDRARDDSASPAARAEVALIEALRARAAGEPYSDPALEALELAREADDGELAREAHVVLFHARRDAGDARGAKSHLEAALTLRARVADALPEEFRRRFLLRKDLAELTQLEAAAASGERACERCGELGCDAACRPTLRPSSMLPPSSGAPAPQTPRGIVGRDPAVAALLAAVNKIGPSDATVLVHGESGTGKELVAEAIHAASARAKGPLVKVNCAALVETLLLSELFGHEKGAFTGAAGRRRGRFELAEGGTLFLDEIGDISPRTQVALLRVLQEKTFERVGGVSPIRANVRIVCATHRDLKAMVARGEFREDLYYRLCGVVLEVPALRNRLGDLGAIASAILGRISVERGAPAKRLSSKATELLARHAWPGNVRELENALRAAALFAEEATLEPEDFTGNVDSLRYLAEVSLPPDSVGMGPASSGFDVKQDASAFADPSGNERSSATAIDVAYAQIRQGVSLHDMKRLIERDCIARALSESGGNITRAATLLGMKRPRLSQLVKQYGFGGADGGTDGESEDM